MAKAKMSAHRQSADNVLKGAKQLRTHTNKVWQLAPKCPMFTRKIAKDVKGAPPTKKVVRTKRLINNHAYKIASSGAAGWANEVLARESTQLRLPYKSESKRAPWLPSVTKGAISLLEHFLCAYAQQATRNAVNTRDALKSHKRLNGALMQVGFEQADADIFGTAMLVPSRVFVMNPDPVKKKKGRATEQAEDDKDYEAPPEDEGDDE